MLGRKKSVKNSDWKFMHENVQNIISREHIEELTKVTVADIIEKTKGKNVAYAWSGGKDSIVLGDLCEKSNINQSMIGLSRLEYPDFENWIMRNKPKGLEVIYTEQDLRWLSKNKEMLFPEASDVHAKWYAIIQHKAQRQYYMSKKLDMIILGRRKKDGNFVGRGTNIYTSKGVTRFSAISEWTHEDISAYIYYNNLEIPSIYEWKNGFVQGTHPWSARARNGSLVQTWEEVYDIDKSIVEGASEYFEEAKQIMEEKRKCK